MSRKPICLQRLGYFGNENDDQIPCPYICPTLPETAPPSAIISDHIPWHSHYAFPYNDDDFFWEERPNNVFDQIQNNYTFVLHYTGWHWYGEF
jgi:hypothetical protein